MEFSLFDSFLGALNTAQFSLRRASEEDFGQIASVVNASWEADLIDARVGEEDVARSWRYPQNFDPRFDAVVVEREGSVVGYGNVSWKQKANNLRIYTHNAFLLPEVPDR